MGSNKKVDKSPQNSNLRNILIFSLGFSLIMGAYMTTGGIEQVVLESVSKDDPTFTGDGYISLAILNAAFSISNFLGPSILTLTGDRGAIVLGSLVYGGFVASFLYPLKWLLYTVSGLLGFAAAALWVANGIYFTRCCTKDSIDKNMGIYWTIISAGPLIGNGFVYWKFQGRSHIDYDTRFMVALALTCVSALGTITFLFLGQPVLEEGSVPKKESDDKQGESIFSALIKQFRLLRNKRMLLLILPSMYNGFEIAIFTGIYPTAVSFTNGFGSDARKLVGIVGILTGVGTISGGLVFGVFGKQVVNSNRSLIVTVACISHLIAATLAYVNLPSSSSLGPTSELSWFDPPSVWIVVISAFLLGLADGCLLPQICSAIGVIWPEDPSGALAIFRFFQSATAALTFYCGTMTGLYNQLVVFVGVVLLGTSSYCVNEMLIEKKSKDKGEVTSP